MGSTRASRRCPQITDWVVSIAKSTAPTSLDLEVIDLRDWNLPYDDEPHIPASGKYTTSHTKLWSEKVASAAGYIIVTPQYNWGYSAVLKNALDHLFKEWEAKPFGIVSYGGHGGVRAAAQLEQVIGGLHATVLETKPAFTLTGAQVRGGELDIEKEWVGYVEDVKKVVEQMVAAVEEKKFEEDDKA